MAFDPIVFANPDTGMSEGLQFSNLSAQSIQNYLKNNRSTGTDEKLINYYLSENSAQTARKWDEYMDSTKYQRLVKDLSDAGINPYWVLNNASAGAVSSGGNSYSGSQSTSSANNALNNTLKGASILIGLIALLARL